MVYNGLGAVYIFIMLFLVYRGGVYYMKQRKDHKKNFSFMKFFLGTNKCKGKYVAVLDADDLSKKNRIKKTVLFSIN